MNEYLKDIKINNYTLNISKLNLTQKDFEIAKEEYERNRIIYNLAHDLEQHLYDFNNKVYLVIDKLVFDTFRDIGGCYNPETILQAMTDLSLLQRVIKSVNEQIKMLDVYEATLTQTEQGTWQYNPIHGYQLAVPKEPFKPTEELFTSIKNRWEEIYGKYI
jgi:hypothetical protein